MNKDITEIWAWISSKTSTKTRIYKDIEIWINETLIEIERLVKFKIWAILINIAWGSASWKTEKVSKILEQRLEWRVLRISLDDYYLGKKYMDGQEVLWNKLNWDQPEALDMKRAARDISMLKSWIAIKKPNYCMKTSEPQEDTDVIPKKIILLEWLFALRDDIAECADLKIYVDADSNTRLNRRIARDLKRNWNSEQETIRYFKEIVEPMHKKYVESTKNRATIIIENHLNPEKENINNFIY